MLEADFELWVQWPHHWDKKAFADGRCDWRRNHDKALWGGGVGWGGDWKASLITHFPLSRTLNSLQMKMLRRMRRIQKVREETLQIIQKSKVRGSLSLVSWCPSALLFTILALFSPLSHQALQMRMRTRTESVLQLSWRRNPKLLLGRVASSSKSWR